MGVKVSFFFLKRLKNVQTTHLSSLALHYCFTTSISSGVHEWNVIIDLSGCTSQKMNLFVYEG